MNSNKLILGLTGGIGTGKSTAADFFKKRGFIHIDADRIGWEITADGSPLLEELDEIFGPEGEYGLSDIPILDSNGSLLRRKLAEIVFSDKKRTELFDRIMFSRIAKIIEQRIYDAPAGSNILVDAPLLFESGANDLCDFVILLVADIKTRISRVCLRDGVSKREVRDRIKSQMSDEEKIPLADYVLDNSGNVEELYLKLNQIICNFSVDKRDDCP